MSSWNLQSEHECEDSTRLHRLPCWLLLLWKQSRHCLRFMLSWLLLPLDVNSSNSDACTSRYLHAGWCFSADSLRQEVLQSIYSTIGLHLVPSRFLLQL